MENSLHDDPAPALAGFRNLRQLNIFTRVYRCVPQEYISVTLSRTRETVQHWLNRILLMKTGASFEEVVLHAESEVMNAEISFKLSNLRSIYNYKGKRNSNGNVEICEDRSLWHDMPAKAKARR